jgi:hypothetical protein
MSRRRRQNGDSGSALVEFAISSVVILSVLFGIIDAGRALYAFDWVGNAARQGTRFMIVRGLYCVYDPVPLPGGCPATAADSTNYITNATGNGLDTTGIDTSQVTVTTTCFLVGHALGPPPCAPTGWVIVNVQYNFRFITPFLAAIPPWQMTSTSKVIVQN